MTSNLNGRVHALEQQGGDRAPVITDAERDRRLQALFDLYEARGWRPTGEAGADRRFAGLLYVMVRVAERAARENPTPEAMARAELWRERQSLFKAT